MRYKLFGIVFTAYVVYNYCVDELGRQTYIVLPIGLLPSMKLMKFLRRKFNIKKLRISILLITLLCFSVFMGSCTNSHHDDYKQFPNDSASASENYNDDKSLKLERSVLMLTDYLINYVVADAWLLDDYVFSTDDANNFLTSLCLFKDELSHPYCNKVCISEVGKENCKNCYEIFFLNNLFSTNEKTINIENSSL